MFVLFLTKLILKPPKPRYVLSILTKVPSTEASCFALEGCFTEHTLTVLPYSLIISGLMPFF